MKAHVGVDAESSLVHGVIGSPRVRAGLQSGDI
jgi:hypothetical protein